MATSEINPAAAIIRNEGIGLNVRKFAAELEGVLTLQNREAILNIPIRVGRNGLRTVVPGARQGKVSDSEVGEPGDTRQARVDGAGEAGVVATRKKDMRL